MRKMVEVIQQPMNLLGLNPLKTDTLFNYYIPIFLFLMIMGYGYCGIILFVYHSDDFLIALPYLFCGLSLFIFYFKAHFDKTSIAYVLSRMNNDIFQYPDEFDILVEYKGYLSEEKVTTVQLSILLLQISGYALAMLSPLIAYFVLGTLELSIIYPQWFPWSQKSLFSRILSYILQVLSGIYLYIFVYMVQIYFIFVTIEFWRQHKKLKHAIETLNERSYRRVFLMKYDEHQEKPVQFYREEYDNVFSSNIIMCIRHHQEIIKLFKKFKIFFNFEYSLQLLNMYVSYILILVILFEKTNPLYGLQALGVAWTLMTSLFFRCFVGEQFSAMNLEIKDALFYNLNWYDQSAKNKKLISIFHCAASQSYTLKGFGIFPASLYIFAYIIRSTYSYFNFIRASF